MQTKSLSALAIFLLALPMTSFARDLTTLPWNGYKGAATFTFDDGLQNQIDNVIPELASRGIHASFFMVGTNVQNAWINAAKSGNEIGNHTKTHSNLTGLDSPSIQGEIVDEAEYLRNLDPSIEAVTLAYPYCASNSLVDNITNSENIIGRTCGWYARFAWNTAPTNWMQLTSYVISDSASIANLPGEIEYAANNRTWLVTLSHGVGPETGNTPVKVITDMFDQAISDSLWIETYQQVAAYWRASFTMDTVQAQSSISGWHFDWTSPHPHMPRSVMLRIKPDATKFGNTFLVYQKGKLIAPESDGAYLIDFMDLQLDISKAPTPIRNRRSKSLQAGMYHYHMENVAGQTVRQGEIQIHKDNAVPALIAHEGNQNLILQITPH